MGTTLFPNAGYIPDLSHGADPGLLSNSEREYLRILATKVLEISSDVDQENKRNLWYQHNQLKSKKPLLLVFPEDSWIEIIGEDKLQIKDPFWRQWEWYLRHLIYRHEKLKDDFVIEPELYIRKVMHIGGWGMSAQYISSGQEKGACRWDPPLREPNEISKLRHPTVMVDENATQRAFSAVSEVFSDLLNVSVYCALPHANMIGEATMLRGIEQIMLDMYERPQWLHQLMKFISDGILNIVNFLEENGHLSLNNRNHYNDSGGIGYSYELPAPGFDGKHVRLCDLWGFGVAQELAWVSPGQHEEFLLNYQLPILERCGLNAYGCCESYENKFDMLKRRIPRLRRVSVSPWCDIEKAANELQDKYIFSWKPNPAMVSVNFNPGHIRKYIRRTLDIAKGCVLEIILKDTFTIEKEPERLEIWTKITREEIERI
ncbi:MAG: hypothetical protein ACUVWN_01070 [bacterium]